MSNDVKVEKPKEFRVSANELSGLSFMVQNLKIKNMEADFWRNVTQNYEAEIAKRLSILSDDISLDWSRIFPEGIIMTRKIIKPQPKIEVKPEVNKNDSNTSETTIGKPSI